MSERHWVLRLRDEMESLRREVETYRDLYLRTRADFINYKKAIDEKWKIAVDYASERVVRELLPIIDNFKRALNSNSPDFEAYKAGILLIYSQLIDVLQKEGLKEIEVIGKLFDPKYHEAISLVESEEPDGTIIDVFESGYMFKERLLRPAKVVVSKGIPKKDKLNSGGEKDG